MRAQDNSIAESGTLPLFNRKTDTMPANSIVGVLTARQDTMPVS